MISLLERGLRRPSVSLAEALITGYRMDAAGADAVRAIAIDWAGRDSPFRTGVTPPWGGLGTVAGHTGQRDTRRQRCTVPGGS